MILKFINIIERNKTSVPPYSVKKNHGERANSHKFINKKKLLKNPRAIILKLKTSTALIIDQKKIEKNFKKDEFIQFFSVKLHKGNL